MRLAINAVGSCIYTAWVDAGQPIIGEIETLTIKEEPIVPDKNIKARAHDN